MAQSRSSLVADSGVAQTGAGGRKTPMKISGVGQYVGGIRRYLPGLLSLCLLVLFTVRWANSLCFGLERVGVCVRAVCRHR